MPKISNSTLFCCFSSSSFTTVSKIHYWGISKSRQFINLSLIVELKGHSNIFIIFLSTKFVAIIESLVNLWIVFQCIERLEDVFLILIPFVCIFILKEFFLLLFFFFFLCLFSFYSLFGWITCMRHKIYTFKTLYF